MATPAKTRCISFKPGEHEGVWAYSNPKDIQLQIRQSRTSPRLVQGCGEPDSGGSLKPAGKLLMAAGNILNGK